MKLGVQADRWGSLRVAWGMRDFRGDEKEKKALSSLLGFSV
jgi:hypothetical protein